MCTWMWSMTAHLKMLTPLSAIKSSAISSSGWSSKGDDSWSKYPREGTASITEVSELFLYNEEVFTVRMKLNSYKVGTLYGIINLDPFLALYVVISRHIITSMTVSYWLKHRVWSAMKDDGCGIKYLRRPFQYFMCVKQLLGCKRGWLTGSLCNFRAIGWLHHKQGERYQMETGFDQQLTIWSHTTAYSLRDVVDYIPRVSQAPGLEKRCTWVLSPQHV